MGANTKIEWTDATWNPVVGCSIVSPGCTNCYAMRQAWRIKHMEEARTGDPARSHYFGTTQIVSGKAVWTGKVTLAPDHILTQPLRWQKPRRIFVNSMGDLFHEDVPDEWIDRVFAIMALTPQHTFQVLTKRAERMCRYVKRNLHNGCGLDRVLGNELFTEYKRAIREKRKLPVFALPLPNVWLGVSTEDQRRADERIHHLLDTPATVRFVSAEPLLGPIDFRYLQPGDPPVEIDALNGTHGVLRPHGGTSPRLDWVIVGGESGPGARPMHPDWARSIRDQCNSAGVAFHFKQWGQFKHGSTFGKEPSRDVIVFNDGVVLRDTTRTACLVEERTRGWAGRSPEMMARVGKKRAARELDGRQHNDFPQVTR